MKIAISATGDKIESQISPVFGRCPYFAIVEIENKKIKKAKFIENNAVMQMGGAGIMASQTVANEKVEAVMSVAMGPRAFSFFQRLGIKIYTSIQGTVKENSELYIKGELKEMQTA